MTPNTPSTPKRTGVYQNGDHPCTNCKKYVPVAFGGLCVVCAERNASEDNSTDLIEQRDALLAALVEVDSWRMQSLDMMPPEVRGAWLRAHAAISKATGKP